MSQQQKAILQRIISLIWKTSLVLVDFLLLVTMTFLSWTIRSSNWILGKLTPLKLKVKELYNDTRTTTKA